uniref:SPRY-associated domain-containing protein n=1 Tax=Salarias fasciatus TaxID=181472 RepID=A0A672I9B1_SALFA
MNPTWQSVASISQQPHKRRAKHRSGFHCWFFSRLSGCGLSERSCGALSSVLSSQSSSLTHLDLSNNQLQDSGVKLLSSGLKSPHCHLEALSLSGCLVSEEGCASLVSAVSSKSSHLRELDLSYNHPGASGVEKLFWSSTGGLWSRSGPRRRPIQSHSGGQSPQLHDWRESSDPPGQILLQYQRKL